jgi:glycolate oxidase iron-sulfur subunit
MDFDDLNYGNLDFGVTQDNYHSKFYVPAASDCMRCGLCLSSCPTYNLFQIETETPRHRIRTINKIINENQAVTNEERGHLDNCLQCRACEPVCPSKMAYGELFDETQRQLARPLSLLAKLAFWFIEHKQWRTRLMPLVALYIKSGIQQPLRKGGLLQRLHLADAETLVTMPVLRKLKNRYPSKTGKTLGKVGLFTGCIAESFDRDTLEAAIQLLTTIGYEVIVPRQQSCCGAIHQHNGQSAQQMIANNLHIFNNLYLDTIIFTATGCGAMLSEYSLSNLEAEVFNPQLADINEFLLQHWPDDLILKPSQLTVAVHEPCSQRNVLKNQHAVYALLTKIPGINLVSLPESHYCCGAGGSYLLTHPENAAALRAQKIQLINQLKPDAVISSNFGCGLFINNELQNQAGCKVVHPIEILASSC